MIPDSQERASEAAPARPLWPVRVGLGVVVAVYLLYSSFGVACPFLWGHHGYHGATYMLRAIMTLRFHIITPSNWAGFDYPPRFSWYFHHPIGYHHLLVPLVALLGNHEWVARGFAAAGGLLVLAALYAIGRRWWSREGGLLACAVWVALPIVTSFSILSDPMLPAMACCIYTVDVYLRYLDEPTRRRLRLACIAYVVGGLLMWEAYFQAVFHAVHAMLRLLTRAGRAAKMAPGRWNASLGWTFWTGVASSLTMAFHLLFTWRMDMVGDFRGSYAQRHSAEYHYVIAQHEHWFELLYGKPLKWVAMAWLGLFVVRAIAGRARRRDQAVLIFALINTLYIYLFAEGSSVHEYRIFWYSSFFALAVTDLVSDIHGAAHWILRSRPVLARNAALAAALSATAVYFAAEAPHAWHNLVESREMMGTHGLPGYNADYPKQLFAMEVARRTGPDDFVLTHINIPRRIEFYYYMDRSGDDIRSLAQVPSFAKKHSRLVVLMDAFPAESDRALMLDLLKSHPGYVWDRYLMIDLRSNVPGIHEFEFRPQPMSRAWRWFVSHKYPPMKAVEAPGAFSTCAYSALHMKPPAELPAAPAPPASASEAGACWYDYEVLRGDTAGASAWLARLRSTLLHPAGGLTPQVGELFRVLGFQVKRRGGAEMWLGLDKPVPAGASIRWRMEPLGPKRAALSGESPVAAAVADGAPGFIAVQAMAWNAPQGPWRVSLEVVVPKASPRSISDLVPWAPGFHPPPPTTTLARADLGRLEIP